MPQPLCLHLKELESESIYILREVAAQFNRPVLLYSIGKDSSVLLHLARKAFFPGRPPFPLHIDTRWKYGEMIAFRDSTAKRLGLDLIAYVNEEGIAHNINPIDSGSAVHTLVMKTEAQAGPRALRLRRGDRRGATRRGGKPGEGADFFGTRPRSCLGSTAAAARALELVQRSADLFRTRSCGTRVCWGRSREPPDGLPTIHRYC
jgi:hypothetical protein